MSDTLRPATRARTIDDIKEDLNAAHARVANLERELYAAKCDLAGIHPGDIVRAIPSKHWHEKNPYTGLLKVSHVTVYGFGVPSIHAYKRKKNGEWFTSPMYIGAGWRHLTAAEKMELHAKQIA